MKTPWHLWLVGVLSLAWNAMGCWSWYQQISGAPAYYATMTMGQLRYIQATPAWATVAFGLAVWAGLLGALALLLRRRLAFNAYVAGLIGFITSSFNSFVLTDGIGVMGAASVGFAAFVFVLCLVEVGYSRWMAKKGVLR